MKSNQEVFKVLSEGNPNSLGRLLEVLEWIKAKEFTIEGLLDLYEKEDRYVSMRVSNILKRLWREDAQIILTHIDRMINQAQSLKNPTFRWTLAQMYDELFLELTAKQRTQFIIEIQNNLNLGDDWIMLSQSMKALQKALNYGFNIKSIKSRLLALKNHKSKVVRTHAAKLMLRIQSS
jgi:hypothetical protein